MSDSQEYISKINSPTSKYSVMLPTQQLKHTPYH